MPPGSRLTFDKGRRMTQSHRFTTLPLLAAALLAGGLGCNTGDPDPALKAAVEKLEQEQKQTKAHVETLEARIKKLEDKGEPEFRTDGAPGPILQFAKATAASFFDAVLVGDGVETRKYIGEELGKRIASNDFGTIFYTKRLEEWAVAFNQYKQYQSYEITNAALSPTKDQAIIQGTLTGKNAKRAFTITIKVNSAQKVFLIDALTLREQ
jgi:hypothetical protein